MSSPITSFFSNLLTNFKTAEEKAVLPVLATAVTNIGNNPTAINTLAQMSSAVAQIEAAQPAILQAEIQSVASLLQQAAAAVGSTTSTTT